jgi:hypothetical protein
MRSLDIYIANKTPFIGHEEKAEITELLKTTLSENGFVFDAHDPINLIVAINSKEYDSDEFVINLDFILAEEVTAHREGKDVKTFANTYHTSELIESDEPFVDTMQTIEIMLQQFIKSYKLDNEED